MTRFPMYVACLIISAMVTAYLTLGGLLWPYAINSWLEWSGKDPGFTFWWGVLLSFWPVVGQLSIPAAFVTLVASFFVGS